MENKQNELKNDKIDFLEMGKQDSIELSKKNNPDGKKLIRKSQSNYLAYKITLAIEIIIIIILCCVNIVVFNNNSNTIIDDSREIATTEDGICVEFEKKDDISTFVNSLSKGELLTIVKRENGCFPGKILPESFRLKPNDFTYKLLYSYDDVSEVPLIAEDSVMGLDDKKVDDFTLDEITDSYAVVSVDQSKVNCGGLDGSMSSISCYRGVSFKKSYLDYHEVVNGNTYSDEAVINDLSSDFAKIVSGFWLVNDSWNGRSLYGYSFEDEEDKYVLHGLYFGVGVDLNNVEGMTASNIPYAINIYEKRLIIDKTSRSIYWEKHNSDFGGETRMFDIKSVPLTNDEVIEIMAIKNNMSEDEINKLKEQNRDEDEMTDAEMLEARVLAICGDDYTVIYKSSDDTGLFRCNNYSKAIYSITNPERTDADYKNTALATYLGTDEDEIVDRYFGDKRYIFQDYRHADIINQLVLLIESNSEEALVEQNLDAIYEYVKETNSEYKTDLELTIFYTENLNQVHELKDYIILLGAAGFVSAWLPNGNGFGKYYYGEDKEVAALNEIARNPSLYASQTRDAIKFHRHINATIENGREITKEALRELLYNSFVDGV